MNLPGGAEWIIILAIAALLFGAKRIPDIGGALGQSIRDFKRGLAEDDAERDRAAQPADEATERSEDPVTR